MKNYFLFLIVLINSFYIFSQEIVKDEIDEFEKIRIIETNWLPMYKGLMPGKTYLFRFSSIDTVKFLDIKISTTNNMVFSINAGDEKVLLKCNDSLIFKLSNTGYAITERGGGSEGLWGGNTYGIWIKLTHKNFNYFSDIQRITKIRIYTNDGYLEEEISLEKSNEILELYKLFEKTFNKKKH
ncbi:MAG: hypothetical protein CVU04_03300 [Bacteroidetes bacterium HGW-Bacteroidetes-20]|nr:MAG: hypothetical protein CVU04_03300 [Bacteroidetes bacterium HGW-Bacteroidetes-20]